MLGERIIERRCAAANRVRWPARYTSETSLMNRALTAAGSSSVIAMIDQAYTCTRSGEPSGPISPASGYMSATASTIAVDSNSVAPSPSVSAGTPPERMTLQMLSLGALVTRKRAG